jgi:hypothetical protein
MMVRIALRGYDELSERVAQVAHRRNDASAQIRLDDPRVWPRVICLTGGPASTACSATSSLPSSCRWQQAIAGGSMGDKSPKSKQRGQKQKDDAKAGSAAAAKKKQDGYGQPRVGGPTGKK